MERFRQLEKKTQNLLLAKQKQKTENKKNYLIKGE